MYKWGKTYLFKELNGKRPRSMTTMELEITKWSMCMALTVYSLLVAFWLTYHSLSTTLFQHTPITHWSSKASSYAWEDDGICQERSNMTKFKRTGNTHRGTLHAHGDRNNWYIRETIILCWSRCRLRLWINWRWNQVFFVSPTNLKLIEGGALFEGGAYLMFGLTGARLFGEGR